MKSIKKIIFGLTFGSLIAGGLFAAPKASNKGKSMDVLNGKEGIFAVIDTDGGEIVLNLFYKETPMTVTNFVGLAEGTLKAANGKPFYDGLKFHRVISKANGDGQDFMIQGGDPKGNGTGGPGYKFIDEFVDGLTFDKGGKLAMANSGANTNGSQFFITIVPTEWLNYKHTIFGEVLAGQDIVDKVSQDDKIIKISIIRNGNDAKKFNASQENFDSLVLEIEKKNKEAAEKELAEVTKDCQKDTNGIYYQILKNGNGLKAGKGKNVKVEYKGYLIDGNIFDGSAKLVKGGHEPLDFVTDAKQMIPGFDIMVQDMKVGELRKMVIPPELAYGVRGYPPVIPGNAYICFDVELISAR